MRETPRILIVGAGIAGLCLAIGLARLGLRATVIERQAAWRQLGSGIQMQGNALAALDRLGVADALLARCWASPDDSMIITDEGGQAVTRVTYPRLAGPHRPAATGVRRQALHDVLLGAVAAAGGSVRMGTTLAAIDPGLPDGPPARYRLSDGTTGDADLVVAAEGIASPLRGRFFTATRRATGFGVWRADLPRPAGLDDKIMMMAPGLRFGIIPTDDRTLYFFATSQESPDQRLDPTQMDRLLRHRFAPFGGWAATLMDAIDRPDQVVFTQAEEVYQQPPWHHGRVVLLGDAAHASTPFLSQGGAMGIEDAVVLAEEIAGGDVAGAPARFAVRRAPRCLMVQDASRAAGQAGAITDRRAHRDMLAALPSQAQARIDAVYDALAQPI